MDSATQDEPRIKWRTPAIVMVVAIAAVFVLEVANPDFGVIASALLVIPIAGLVLFGLSIAGRGRTMLVRFGLLFIFGLLSWQMIHHSEGIRSEVRWLAGSRAWKAKVLDQAPEPGSQLKTVIWDGWGMFAQDTDVYLVFSPDDGLRNYSPTNLSGLPVPVWHVQRLEKYWYSVTFYTNDGWYDHGAAQP